MAYEKLTGLSTDNTVSLGKPDAKTGKTTTQVEGYYLGSKTINTTTGESVVHVFQTSKGNLGVWGSKTLNETLVVGVRGFMIKVDYLGKKKLAGGKTIHTYDFGIDRANKIDVADTMSAESDDDGGGSFEETEGNFADEDNSQNAALLAAERKSRTEKLLKSKQN